MEPYPGTQDHCILDLHALPSFITRDKNLGHFERLVRIILESLFIVDPHSIVCVHGVPDHGS